MADKKWEVLSEKKTENITQILLKNRGITSKKDTEEFLNPKLEDVTIQSVGVNKVQLKKAVDRIKKAIKDKEEVVIFGDYDVDGICGTAILWETLYSLSKNVHPYIPHRIDEGYGLSIAGISNVNVQIPNVKLIITVDNGIVANEAVEYANKLGIDVIITDHHVPSKKLPNAFEVVHTTKLCGTGVAYILSEEFKKNTEHLSLVALATIADLVPLVGSNRTLLKFGLEQLKKTKRVGILELCKEAILNPAEIGTYEIGHMIAPRLNAMGRLEYAMDSLRLLCTTNKKRAQELAHLLGSTNRERQQLTIETVAHASSTIRNTKQAVKNKLLFISHESYQPGVIGLVAGRLVEEYYLPSIVVAKGNPNSKASARSISGFNIIDFIREASDMLVDVGGHPMAAGFTVETSKLEQLQLKLEKLAAKMLDVGLLQRTLKIDCEIPLEDISEDLYNQIKKLEPFGMKNPQPVFVSRNLRIVDMRLVGKENKHLKIKVQHDGVKLIIDGIGFGLGERSSEFHIGDFVDVVYSLELEEWNGNKKLQLKIKDIKKVSNQKQ